MLPSLVLTRPRSRGAQGSRELRGVQVLRFVTALVVVLSHLTWYLGDRLGADLPHPPLGRAAVGTFFAISGFVAVVVTSRHPAPAPGDFVRRRLVRIVPLAWAFTTVKLVTALVAPDALSRGGTDPSYVVLSYLFLPARGADGIVQPLYTVCWTLSFELLFYVLVAVALLVRRDPVVLVPPVLVLLALGSAVRGEDWPTWAFYADRLVLCFVVGMLVGRWHRDRDTRSFVGWTGATWAVWLIVTLPTAAPPLALLLLPVATIALVGAVALERPLLHRSPQWLTTLGDASYCLYLAHPVVAPATLAALAAAGLAGPDDAWWCGILAVAASVAASVVLWKLVDRPLNRWLLRATGPRGDTRPH